MEVNTHHPGTAVPSGIERLQWVLNKRVGGHHTTSGCSKKKRKISCVNQTTVSWSLSLRPNHCPDWGVHCVGGHACTPIKETTWNVKIFSFNEALLLLCNVKVVLYKVSCSVICNVKSKIVFLCTAVHWQDE
jgi:hypothetical protein